VCATCLEEGRVSRATIPWAERHDLGLFTAAWRTVLQVSGEPTSFFDRVRSGRGRLSDAALFAFLVAIPGGIVGGLYNAALFGFFFAQGGVLEQALGGAGPEFREAMMDASAGWVMQTVVSVIIAPFLTVAGQLAISLLHHLVLKLLGAATRELEATLEASMYACGVNLWGVVPILGLFVGFWVMVAQAIGYSRVHEVEVGRPVAAVISPICVCVCFVGVAWGVIMAAVLAGTA